MAVERSERMLREQRFSTTNGGRGEGDRRENEGSPSAPARMTDVNLSVQQSGETRLRTGSWNGESFLGPNTHFEGTIRTEETLRVRGSVEGEIASQGEVELTGTAQVKATLRSSQLVVAGHLEGTVRCDGRVELGSSSRVVGEIHAGTLVIHEGAFVDGKVHMGPVEPETQGQQAQSETAGRGVVSPPDAQPA